MGVNRIMTYLVQSVREMRNKLNFINGVFNAKKAYKLRAGDVVK